MQENKYFFRPLFYNSYFFVPLSPLRGKFMVLCHSMWRPHCARNWQYLPWLGRGRIKKRTFALQSVEPTPPGKDIYRWIQTNYKQFDHQKIGQGLAARRIRDPPPIKIKRDRTLLSGPSPLIQTLVWGRTSNPALFCAERRLVQLSSGH
jgi:hypothetical protein